MPWNQPGSSGNGGKDPWGQPGGDKGPPDLDEILRRVQRRFGGLFGGGGGSSSSRGSAGGGAGGAVIVLLLALLAVAAWDSWYRVVEGQEAVVLRFGQYKETTGPGLHFRWPRPIESHEILDTQRVKTVTVGYRDTGRGQTAIPKEALMLTMDENIIELRLAVQYRILEPKDFLFHVSEPEDVVVRTATESAVREIVGKSTMDFVITTGRAEIVQKTHLLLQDMLKRYQSGIELVTVELQDAKFPPEVKAAFDDAVKAREDEQRLKNEAEAYANDIIPKARGRGARLVQQGEGYKASVLARAEGDARRFESILTEYRKAPEITRKRLYLEAIEEMLSNSSKVLIDQKGGNNILYLPLDRIVQQREATGVDLNAPGPSTSTGPTNSPGERGRLRPSRRTGR
ncbi:MAG: FtsH protease activity modulator HflK [Gammaproteobacteria bacterium]|nr:FtsH protease activity modulator HflK [Gammaproteobacteria bacterium]